MARDLRVQKTYAALMTAFGNLLSKKHFDEITVAEICEHAQVRGATFYKHFADKYEFFSFHIGELQNRFKEEDREADVDACTFFISRIAYLMDFMEAHAEMVASVSRSSLLPSMLNILAERVERPSERTMEEIAKKVHSDVDPTLAATAYSAAVVGTIKWWYLSETRMDKDEFLRQANLLIGSILPA